MQDKCKFPFGMIRRKDLAEMRQVFLLDGLFMVNGCILTQSSLC